jgi:hypothetical protein
MLRLMIATAMALSLSLPFSRRLCARYGGSCSRQDRPRAGDTQTGARGSAMKQRSKRFRA